MKMDGADLVLCLYLLHSRRKKRRNRLQWMHPLHVERPLIGAFVLLFHKFQADVEFRAHPVTDFPPCSSGFYS